LLQEITNNEIPEHDRPLILIFGHNTCGGCGPAKNELERLLSEMNEGDIARYVDLSKNGGLQKQFEIRSVPTLIILDAENRILVRKTGMPKRPDLEAGLSPDAVPVPEPEPQLKPEPRPESRWLVVRLAKALWRWYWG
jgi:thioredoxin-related protein